MGTIATMEVVVLAMAVSTALAMCADILVFALVTTVDVAVLVTSAVTTAAVLVTASFRETSRSVSYSTTPLLTIPIYEFLAVNCDSFWGWQSRFVCFRGQAFSCY